MDKDEKLREQFEKKLGEKGKEVANEFLNASHERKNGILAMAVAKTYKLPELTAIGLAIAVERVSKVMPEEGAVITSVLCSMAEEYIKEVGEDE